ncbi:GNAT family N-acetyltransferase [Streptomyces sp. UNOB3_S3]|uniref:GNAT family N-acetyltransferase n=1 Tax=Streptomyces sp. UNOB3_S3 TaxID=2871682 RepID=UPI001E48BCBB|nr:GNAT family N-acetyltransferase [Streptomyces sp. UNOB3_S3]MCC3777191.1 GNAT family N-acetyltransferase [Streptomyces sp. UNOB3_S3]
MIELVRRTVPATGPWASWFPSGHPGLGALAEHVRATGHGRWWADRAVRPRAAAVSCAGQVILGGDPRVMAPRDLHPFAHGYIATPDRFLPLLGAAFDRVVPWERTVWVRDAPAPVRPPRRPVPGALLRRLSRAPSDAPAVRALGDGHAWIAATWGGAPGLVASGHAWGVFRDGRLLSVACTYFLGGRHEDVAVLTVPEARGRGLASVCVRALCADIAARGRVPSWTCSRDNHPSRALAAATGFRPVREYVHYAAGAPAGRVAPAGARPPAPAGSR